jgi:hypothetical protein
MSVGRIAKMVKSKRDLPVFDDSEKDSAPLFEPVRRRQPGGRNAQRHGNRSKT